MGVDVVTLALAKKYADQVVGGGVVGPQGPPGVNGKNGITFTPSVSPEGVLSWSNDGGLPNPPNMTIKGTDGTDGVDGVTPNITFEIGTVTDTVGDEESSVEVAKTGTDEDPIFTLNFKLKAGKNGENGQDGQNGGTFVPSVTIDGELSWTNDKNLPNPQPVNIKGADGAPGPKGDPFIYDDFTPEQLENLKGPAGPGIAQGGTVGQILVKNSNTDYDTKWTNAPDIDGVLKADGSIPMIGNLDLNGNRIVNVGEPVDTTDGVNKDYVDKEIEKKVTSVYKPVGSIEFAKLPTPTVDILGNVYNVTDTFTADDKFVAEERGKKYSAGTNVAVIEQEGKYYYDALTGIVDVSDFLSKIEGGTVNNDVTVTGHLVGDTIQANNGLSISKVTSLLDQPIPFENVAGDANVQIVIGDPTEDAHGATKAYVDKVAPPTTGATGQILSKSDNGMEWIDKPTEVVYLTGEINGGDTEAGPVNNLNMTNAQIYEAINSGKQVFAILKRKATGEVFNFTPATIDDTSALFLYTLVSNIPNKLVTTLSLLVEGDKGKVEIVSEKISTIATGGTTGQILAKKSDADYDTEWIDNASGTGGGVTYTAGDGIKIENNVISVNLSKASDNATGVVDKQLYTPAQTVINVRPVVMIKTNPVAPKANVTITKGETVISKQTDDKGELQFEVPILGIWNFSVDFTDKNSDMTLAISTPKIYEITIYKNKVFGVEWNKTSTTRLVRTDGATNFVDPVAALENGAGSSPFDDIMPWKGMVRVEDEVAGTLVAIPKYYFQIINEPGKFGIKISPEKIPGFMVSPAHMDRGDGQGERDVVYIGRYLCNSSYKSQTDTSKRLDIPRNSARTSIHKIGEEYWQFDYATWWTINMLYVVEYADWNCQKVIGYGCASNSKTGYTDAMQYHTGTNKATRTEYGFTQYRNIEGLWDNPMNWVDGVVRDKHGLYVTLDPNLFSDNKNNMTLVGTTPSTSGYISSLEQSKTENFEWVLYPNMTKGGNQTYIPDYMASAPSGDSCTCTGGWDHEQATGLFHYYVTSSGYSTSNYGCRLIKLPKTV